MQTIVEQNKNMMSIFRIYSNYEKVDKNISRIYI